MSEAKGYRLQAQLERYDECLRTACYHLRLPQSESGPCDDSSQYDRALEGLIGLLDEAEAKEKLASERRFRAEAALQPFADAGKGVSDFWDDKRAAASLRFDTIKVEHFRKAVQALAINCADKDDVIVRPEQTPATAQARLIALARKVAGLNPAAGEIGAGMLAQLVAEAEAALPQETSDAEPSRTYSVRQEGRHGILRQLIDAEEVTVICADPLTKPRPEGGTTTSIGFPVLIVTAITAQAPELAERIAALLQEAKL